MRYLSIILLALLSIQTVQSARWRPPRPTTDRTAPSIPGGLTASAISPSQINLSWLASTDNVRVTGYKVFRDGVQVSTTTSLSYANTGLIASTTYGYAVSAYDAARNNSSQTTVSSATTPSEDPPVPPEPSDVIGYLGCSMTMGAVEGAIGLGSTLFWDTAPDYSGAGVYQWAKSLNNSYWSAFQSAQDAKPANTIWWELCALKNDADNETYANALIVLEEIKRRIPGVTVYVSAQPSYDPSSHECGIAGTGGQARVASLVNQLISNGVASAGPVIGPLAYPGQTLTDGCHGNDAGEAAMGQQLIDGFSSAIPPPVPPLTGSPIGIYSIDNVVDKPFVDGVLIRVYWSLVEKTEGTYDFSKVASVIKQAKALGQSVSIANLVVATPSWLLAKCETFNSGSFGSVCVPWDVTMLSAVEKLATAISNYQVDGVALKDHPTVKQIDAPIGGIQSIRLTKFPTGYTAAKLQDGVFRSVRAWAGAFPTKHIYVGLFGITDGVNNPTTAESLRDGLLAEFDGVSNPRVNFFQEVLSGSAPSLTSDLGKVVADVKSKTSIMFQACGEWSKQSTWSWCNWASNDTPDAGLSHGYNNFNATYFEIYQADLLNEAYSEQLQKWHDTLFKTN